MDLITYIILIALALTLDGMAVFFKGTLFSNLGGIISLSGLSYLIASGNMVLHTAYSGGFIYANASGNDYVVYVTLLIIFTVVSFLITFGLSWDRSEK